VPAAEPVQGQPQKGIAAGGKIQVQRAQPRSAIVEWQISAQQAPGLAVVRGLHQGAGEKTLFPGVDFHAEDEIAGPGRQDKDRGVVLHGFLQGLRGATAQTGRCRAFEGERDLGSRRIGEAEVGEVGPGGIERPDGQGDSHRTGLGDRHLLPELPGGGWKGLGAR